MKQFKNKVAAITGAGSGIGLALAKDLARRGCHLALADIREDRLFDAIAVIEAANFGVKVTGQVLDVSKREAVYAWAEQCQKEHGKVSLVFNNAGIAQSGTVESNSIEDYETVMNINLWGVIYGTKAFLPYMAAANEGHIVNISSVFGIQAQPSVSAYNASKFAVKGFTESLRQELDMKKSGVSASCVHPGGINTNIINDTHMAESTGDMMGTDTEMVKKRFSAMLRTSPEEAAAVILDGVRKNKRRILIGNDARLLDIQQRLMPVAYQRVNSFAIKLVGAFS